MCIRDRRELIDTFEGKTPSNPRVAKMLAETSKPQHRRVALAGLVAFDGDGKRLRQGSGVPALFGVSVSQINLLLDTVLASFLPTGSVSWLYYSDRLTELPLGVFGIAIATVILPNLSAHRAAAREDQFSLTLDWGIRPVLLIGGPATGALVGTGDPGDTPRSRPSPC